MTIKLHPKLRDPKWQVFVRRALDGFGMFDDLYSFLREQSIPRKYIDEAALAMSVAKWGVVNHDWDGAFQLCGLCTRFIDWDSHCPKCPLGNSYCRELHDTQRRGAPHDEAAFEQKMFDRLYSLHEPNHEKLFGAMP